MVQHVDIPESGLHESKGVSTATVNQVYVTDGGGSGLYKPYSGGATTQIIVNSLGDLPNAVAGVITLAPSTQYFIAAQIDLGTSVIKYSLNSDLCGFSSSLSGITTASTTALLTATNTSLRVENLLLNNSLGDVFDFTSDSASVIFQILSIASTSFVNVGTFNTISSGVVSLSSFAGGANGMSFTGTGAAGNVGILNSRFINYTGKAIDLGTAVIGTFSLNTVIFSGLGGSTSLAGAASSANISIRGTSIHCSYNGAGAALSLINIEDLKWNFSSNFGVENSHADAQGFIGANATATTFSGTSTDGTNAVVVNFGTAFVADLEDRFTITTAGKYTYNGIEDIVITMTANIFSDLTSGSAKQYHFYIAKNGTIIESSKSKNEYTGSTPGANSCSSVVEIVTGDFLELFVEAITATTSITVDTCSIKVNTQ